MGIDGINKDNFDWRNRMAQMAQINKKYVRQAEQSPGYASQKAENNIKDSVEISPDGRQRARETKDETAEMASRYQELREQLEKAREQGEAMAESMRARMKCLLIAMRIMSGDEVPIQDYRYLAKNDLELYAKAVSMRMEKEHPQKHKRLSEDEETGNKGGESDSTSSADAESITRPENGEIQTAASADAE